MKHFAWEKNLSFATQRKEKRHVVYKLKIQKESSTKIQISGKCFKRGGVGKQRNLKASWDRRDVLTKVNKDFRYRDKGKSYLTVVQYQSYFMPDNVTQSRHEWRRDLKQQNRLSTDSIWLNMWANRYFIEN